MSDQLRSLYSRWLNLEADKAAISEDLKELFAEAKGNGYEPKALRIAFRLKASSEGPKAGDVAETAALVDTYIAALSSDAGVRLSRASAHARVENISESDLGVTDEKPTASVIPTAPPGSAPRQSPATIPDDDIEIPAFMRRTA